MLLFRTALYQNKETCPGSFKNEDGRDYLRHLLKASQQLPGTQTNWELQMVYIFFLLIEKEIQSFGFVLSFNMTYLAWDSCPRPIRSADGWSPVQNAVYKVLLTYCLPTQEEAREQELGEEEILKCLRALARILDLLFLCFLKTFL